MYNEATMKTAIEWYGCNCDACCQTVSNALDWHGSKLVLIDDKKLWHLMRREDGSICLYWTQDDDPAQYILWDSLDGER